VVVDGHDLADTLAAADRVHTVDVLTRLARDEIELEDAAVHADTRRGAGREAAVLNQRVLHLPEQVAVVGRDREAFHAAIGLASGRVAEQLGIGVGARVQDGVRIRHIEAAQQTAVRAELEHVGSVLVGDQQRAKHADANALGIEAQSRARVVEVERRRRADERLIPLILQEARVEQRGADVRERLADVGLIV